MKKTTLFIALVALLVSFSQLTYGGTTPETDKNLSSVQEDEDNTRKNNRRRFTPHWSSFEIGLNNYMTSDYSTSLPDNLSFMDINTSKSFNVNINFGQIGIGLTRHLGFVTGVGLEFNNYRFDGNNNIMKNDLGVIIEYDAGADGLDLEKSKLGTTYFVMPLLIEAQLPVSRRNTINIAAGVIGGAKISSSTKMVYYDDGKEKIKEENDYSLNTLRYGPTLRLGYESFQVYATYYMNTMFEENKGPELYPVQIGLSFTFD